MEKMKMVRGLLPMPLNLNIWDEGDILHIDLRVHCRESYEMIDENLPDKEIIAESNFRLVIKEGPIEECGYKTIELICRHFGTEEGDFSEVISQSEAELMMPKGTLPKEAYDENWVTLPVMCMVTFTKGKEYPYDLYVIKKQIDYDEWCKMGELIIDIDKGFRTLDDLFNQFEIPERYHDELISWLK